jgi:LPXTG-motif cell wall-anchored protein
LALTGLGNDSPLLIVVGVGMIALGILGRRRFMGPARRAKRSRVP